MYLVTKGLIDLVRLVHVTIEEGRVHVYGDYVEMFVDLSPVLL